MRGANKEGDYREIGETRLLTKEDAVGKMVVSTHMALAETC